MTKAVRPASSLCVLGMLALPLGAVAQEIRLGSEFQVGFGYGTFNSAVAADADGDFVVAWASYYYYYYSVGVFARRFSSAGAPLASALQLNSYGIGYQSAPAVAADADGDFVVAWETSGQDGSGVGVFARRFSSAGTLTNEFPVNSFTLLDQRHSAVAADADGDFVVAWESFGQDGSLFGVFAQRFSSAGVRLASEFQVNSYAPHDQKAPAVAADADGDFVVAWESFSQDGSTFGVFARRFSSAGIPLASEFQVNSSTAGDQRYSAVAADADGDLVVAWASYHNGSEYDVFARRFSSAGAPLASEFQVNSFTWFTQTHPAVAAGANGDFVVAWDGVLHNNGGDGIFARLFSNTGAPLTSEFQVNSYTNGTQAFPAVAADAEGDFVATWSNGWQAGLFSGIFAQRFRAPVTLDIDGNGSTDALTDGLLVLRWTFGFTGAALVTGAVDLVGCTRCNAAAIANYISGLGLQLNVDGNGTVHPLTDGLLVLRYLFGFTGSTLTTGAVDMQNCLRCDAAAIEPYLAPLI